MSGDAGIRRARLCALTSAAMLGAVLLIGGLRGGAGQTAGSPQPTGSQPTDRQSVSAFASDRDAVRRYELESLREIAADGTASEEIRAQAQRRRMTLLEWMEREAAIEAVLSARGYDTPVVTVHEDSVNVVVRAQTLAREQAAVILELVTRETGITGGNVKIIPIN